MLENIASLMAGAIGITIQKCEQERMALAEKIKDVRLDIARDLHDTIGQNISFMRMKLEYLSETNPQANAGPGSDIKKIAEVANESYDLVRGTLAVLQSNNSISLENLLMGQARQVTERSDLNITFDQQGNPKSLSAMQMRQIFYIFREALSNVEKHAQATQVRVEMRWLQNDLKIGITDNGLGFDPSRDRQEGHYGLKFMRDRAELIQGNFTLWSELGAGTKISLCLPYAA
jgi:two-component system nitrate/nitrite sensor histidine kinase NarX